ncbi:MAG: hypothetical protein C0404_04155 [Verrucomicrobia bacterium]|nr:hypothetical protein [Verrucomicrobiota bacterium]
MFKKLTVRHGDDGITILDFLAAQGNTSKNKAKGLLDTRNVLVNRRRIWMARHELHCGDTVEFPSISVQPEVRKKINLLYRDDFYLAADKPAGILSDGPDSVEQILAGQLGIPSIAAVHRLDRDTSGCLLLASNEESLSKMIPLFRHFEVIKTYEAIVAGRIHQPETAIKTPIDGRPALTQVRRIVSNDRASHVQLRIDTGRTHQIRIHMQSVRHPVLGDRQYGTGVPLDEVTMEIPRQMLHACGIEFEHPLTGKRIRIRSNPPADFRKCLEILGLI